MQFKLLQKTCLIFLKIFARDNRGRSDFQVASTKMPSFLRKRYLLKKSSSSNFQVTSLNLGHFLKNFRSQYRGRSYFKVNVYNGPLFSWTLHLAITGPVQILKWHQKSFIFVKLLARDRSSANFQVTPLNLGYFCKNLACDNKDNWIFQITLRKLLYFYKYFSSR